MMPMPKAADPIVPVPPATTLSYDQQNALMWDANFRGRIKVACLTFAKYIVNESTNTPAHNTRMRWAQGAYANPDMTATAVQPGTVMQDAVQQQGDAISDKDLQTAVEVTIGAAF